MLKLSVACAVADADLEWGRSIVGEWMLAAYEVVTDLGQTDLGQYRFRPVPFLAKLT